MEELMRTISIFFLSVFFNKANKENSRPKVAYYTLQSTESEQIWSVWRIEERKISK